MNRIVTTICMLGIVMAGGCQRATKPLGAPPPSWPRQFFEPSDDKALVWYQIYGHFPDAIEISQSAYRCSGVPTGISVGNHTQAGDGEDWTSFVKHPLSAARLHDQLPKFAQAVETAPDCTIIRGEVPDSATLDYLRDVVGLVTWFFDHGAVAVLDPQTLTWYDREKWRREVFEPNGPVPRQQVVILFSDEADGASAKSFWYHTRGMRKFARPDLSIHHVPPQYQTAVVDMLNRLIEAQAFGGLVPEGQLIQMQSLPPGMTCHHAGDLNDPDFNNTHIEIQWPR